MVTLSKQENFCVYKLRRPDFILTGESGKPGTPEAKGEKGQDGKSGVMYVRWGRTSCPSGADIVYKGRT